MFQTSSGPQVFSVGTLHRRVWQRETENQWELQLGERKFKEKSGNERLGSPICPQGGGAAEKIPCVAQPHSLLLGSVYSK